MPLTKEEFELSWRSSSGYSMNQYNDERVTVPCNCDYENCQGWAAMTKSEFKWEVEMGFRKE